MSYMETLQTKQNHAYERLKELVADAEERGLTPELKGNIEAANVAYDEAKSAATEMRAFREKVDAADQARGQIAAAITAQTGSAPKDKEVTDWFQRAIQSAAASPADSGQWFGAEVRTNVQQGSWMGRALNSGVSTAIGVGTVVPTTIADFVAVYERTLNPVMSLATVLSTTTGAPIVIPRITADPVSGGSVTAEAGGITEGDATFNRVQLTAFKIAHTQLFSYELGQDEVIGLDQFLSASVARAVGLGWGTFFTLGTGTTQPQGFLPVSTNAGTALGTANGQATDKYWSATDLVNLMYSLAAPYRQNGSWMTASVNKMRSFKDSTGQFLWAPGNLATGQPDTFLGRPVYENAQMAAAGSANTSIAFGDFSKYVVRDVQPIRIDISNQYKFNTDQLALRYITRRDGNLSDTTAIAFLVSQAI